MGISILLRLSPMENPRSPKIIILNKDKTKIGRKSDVTMDTSHGKEVSKHHTTIYRKVHHFNEIWIVEDNDSLNGTFVNGKKVHRIIVSHGDEIVFGGGSIFNLGDIIASTDLAECRYVFYNVPLSVHFRKDIDLNASLIASDLLEMCAICYCPIVAPEKLPCGHQFCLSCIHKWGNVCLKSMKPCICPMCRTLFAISELTPEEAKKTLYELKVFSMESMLRELHVKNCKQIKRVNIFKKWNDSHRQYFYYLLEKAKSNDSRLLIFLHLAKATVSHSFIQTTQALKNGITNIGGDPSGSEKNELIRKFLLTLFQILIPKPPKNTISLTTKPISARRIRR